MTPLRRALTGALVAAAVACGVHAQAPTEKLLAPLPAGWAPHAETRDGVMIQEMFPAHDTHDDWSDVVRVVIYRATLPLAAAFDRVEQTYGADCQTPPVLGKRQEFNERGYATGVQFVLCERTKVDGRAEGMVYKAIMGRDATYQVQRAWRLTQAQLGDGSTLKDYIDDANAYLRTAYVCDLGDPQRPCPQIVDRP